MDFNTSFGSKCLGGIIGVCNGEGGMTQVVSMCHGDDG